MSEFMVSAFGTPIEITMLHTQLVNFKSDDFHSAVAKNIEEITKLTEAGLVCMHV